MYIWLIISIYFILLLTIAYKDYKKNTDTNEFIIGNRNIGLIGTLSSLSASFRDGPGITFWIAMGFSFIYGSYNIFIGFFIGAYIMSLFAPQARRIAKEKNFITVPQFVKYYIGGKTEKLSAIIVVTYSFLYTGLQLFVFYQIINLLFGASSLLALLLTVSVVGIYTFIGGYKTIIKTDIFQLGIMLLLFIVVFNLPFEQKHLLDFSSFIRKPTTGDFFFPILQASTLIYSFSEVWQRVFSAKSDKIAKNGLKLSILGVLIGTVPLTLIGISAKNFLPNNINPNDVLLMILQSNILSEWLLGIFAIVVIASVMSTIDTINYSVSSIISESFIKIDINKNKKQYLYVSKIITIIFLSFSTISSFYINDIVMYLFGTASLLGILSPIFLLSVSGCIKKYNSNIDKYFSISLLLCFIISLYLFFNGYLSNFLKMCIPVGLSSIITLLGLFIFRKNIFKFNLQENQLTEKINTPKKSAAMFGLDARIALTIFGALSVISGAALYSTLNKIEQTVLLTDLKEIGKAWESYYLDTRNPWLPIYNPSRPEDNYLRDMRALKSNIANLSGWKGPYISYELDSVDYRLKHSRYKYVYINVARDTTWSNPYNISTALCNYSDPCYIWSSIAGVPDKETVEK